MVRASLAIIAVAAGLAFSSTLTQAAVDQTTTDFMVCRLGKAVRSIRITLTAEKGCQITYTKGGVDDVVGSSRFAKGCLPVMENIKTNLEASNWVCKQKNQGRVLYGIEAIPEPSSEEP